MKDVRKYYIEKISELKRTCHNDNCQAPLECPLTHMECKKDLGLDTIMAWLLAEALDSYIKGLITPEELDIISVIIWHIVGYHPDKVRESIYLLIDRITGVRGDEIIFRILEKRKKNERD